MARRLPWFRCYDDFFSSPSHAELDGDDLLVGITVMSLIWSACCALDELQPWAVLPTGKAVSLTGIAQKARKSLDVVERSIPKLLDTGTFARRDDGAIGMPKFPEKHRGESTERSQKSRARAAGRPWPQPVADYTEEEIAAAERAAFVPTIAVTSTRPPVVGSVDAQRNVALAQLKEKLQYGWKDGGPPRPRGLDPLKPHVPGIFKLFENAWTVDEILAAIDKVAELVEAGELELTDWTGTKVLSPWLDGFRAKHAQWSRKRKPAIARAAEPEVTGPLMDPDKMAAAAAAATDKVRRGESLA